MNIIPIKVDEHLIQMYQRIFPQVVQDLYHENQIKEKMNGVFGDQAIWRGIQIENQTVAFCTVGSINEKIMFIYNVGVDPNFRRKGLASQLLNSIINEYQSKDIYLFVDKSNRTAISLYRKFNFEYIDNAFVPPQGEICLSRLSC